jgi:hypothetical protein
MGCLQILQSAQVLKQEPHILQESLLDIIRKRRTIPIRIMSIDLMDLNELYCIWTIISNKFSLDEKN